MVAFGSFVRIPNGDLMGQVTQSLVTVIFMETQFCAWYFTVDIHFPSPSGFCSNE